MRVRRPPRGSLIATVLIGAALCLGCEETEVVESFPDSFVGVGVELTLKDDFPVVVRTISGGPADSAGLLPEDVILAIDGTTTHEQSLGNVVVSLRGEPDSQVTLSVDRQGTEILVVVRRTTMTKGAKEYTAERGDHPETKKKKRKPTGKKKKKKKRKRR